MNLLFLSTTFFLSGIAGTLALTKNKWKPHANSSPLGITMKALGLATLITSTTTFVLLEIAKKETDSKSFYELTQWMKRTFQTERKIDPNTVVDPDKQVRTFNDLWRLIRKGE